MANRTAEEYEKEIEGLKRALENREEDICKIGSKCSEYSQQCCKYETENAKLKATIKTLKWVIKK